MTHLDIEKLDVDGALRESAEEVGFDRSSFMKKGAAAAGGIVVGGMAFNQFVAGAEAAISTQRKSVTNDLKIGNYALTLEYLESEFYIQAVRNLGASGFGGNAALARFAVVTRDHEVAHVKALKQLLGGRAVKKPKFTFGNAVTDLATFQKVAQDLEDTGVSAYAGQGPNILSRGIVKAALSIHSVEARHAAWIRFINSGGVGPERNLPSPTAFDKARSERSVLRIVDRTNFIKGF